MLFSILNSSRISLELTPFSYIELTLFNYILAKLITDFHVKKQALKDTIITESILNNDF